MDIQKEREAFEDSFKIKWEIGHYILKMVKFIEDSQDYAPVNAVKQMSDEYYWVLALNTGWWAWQASKAQAVPEGYKIVPVEPKQETIKQMNKVWFESNCAHIMKTKTAELLYKAMLETQEPK